MFLLSLEVENFRLLPAVHLTFGRGLNVLYGPNDIGKSSLAEALRVAFLLSATSKYGARFVPWGTNLIPRVVVKFEMNNVVWQITKTFGEGKGTALLERVGENDRLFKEASSKAVEEKLRTIISWGIAPGGKGLPESYLSTALLGWQDQVTAILNASPEQDGDTGGLELVTRALGALGQDSRVSHLLQRLQERTEKVYTEGGQRRNTKDSPLVQLSNKLEEQKKSLAKLEESVLKSAEIEQKVQSLSEHRALAAEACSRLEREIKLLQTVMMAEHELERVRAREESVGEARRVLAEAEEDLRGKESRCEETASALSKIDGELQTARDRLATMQGGRDKARENAQQTLDARRVELIALRDSAGRRALSVQEVIKARGALAQAEAEHQRGQQAIDHAQNIAEHTGRLAELQHAREIVEALRAAKTERDNQAANVTTAAVELHKAQAALQDAERRVQSQKDALATAQREAAEQHLRKETLRVTLSRVEAGERDALQAVAQAKAAMACRDRLAVLEKSLADLEADEGDLETKLDANAAAKQDCEARQKVLVPMPIQAALLVGLLSGAIAAAVGLGLQVPAAILAVSIVGSSLIAAGVAASILRHRKVRRTTQLSRLEMDDLAKAREKLLEKRNQVMAKREGVQARVDAARSERDQAAALVGEFDAALDQAESRLQALRRELDTIRTELATLGGHRLQGNGFAGSPAAAGEQAVVDLKEQVSAKANMLEQARHRCTEAQVRFEAATSSAASVDLPSLEERVNAARMKADGAVASDPEEGQRQLQDVKRIAIELETAMRVAKAGLSSALARFERMAKVPGQPTEQALAEAEKQREDADKALESLHETSVGEEAAAEKEFLEAKAGVARLGEEQKTTRTEAEAATQARDETRARRGQAQGSLEALVSSMPSDSLPDAEAALAHARSQLESDPGGSISLPANLAAVEALLEQQHAELQRTENELQQARGQLKFVGGTVAREQRDQESESLDGLKGSADDLELEFEATKRLLYVLKEEEEKHAQHLGRSLAKPVTEIFSEFTSGRYAQIVLDPGLRLQGVMAKGSERDLASLSVGTRDQLATLVRLALAAHLKSVIVLDDQLAQCDPQRLDWFQKRLRESVREHEHQIIVITCRPLAYLQPEEMPVAPCDRLETENGRLAVVDLKRHIVRAI
jgi:chromosome segregation ATPase